MSYEDRERAQSQREQASQAAQAGSKPAIAPGKRTRTMGLPPPPADIRATVQQKRDPMTDAARQEQRELTARWIDTAVRPDLHPPPVQMDGAVTRPEADVHRLAAHGISGAPTTLPHLEQIQRSFGHYDVGGIEAHIGGPAAQASQGMGAEAYATGNDVAFRASPDLHTAAHEAAHVVQQRGSVQLAGGVGQAGDSYEQHADAVADAVVAGRSAEALLGRVSPSSPGRGGAADVQMSAGASAPAVQMRDLDEERGRQAERGTEELDRRVEGNHGPQEDGSGGWGADSDERGLTDRANHYMWTRVSLAAESLGLPNAARHMRHYLGNTGQSLDVDPDLMLRDVPELQEAYDRQTEALRAQANQRVLGMTVSSPATFSLSTARRSDVYCRKDVSQDWFYAIGGFTYWVTAEVTVTPPETEGGPITASMSTQLHIFDRYNWDQGKSVTIAGMTITDEQLGRLHRVGLAREYDINGTSSPRTITWEVSEHASTPAALPTTAASERAGGRSDPSRERGRHFDNVRGSE